MASIHHTAVFDAIALAVTDFADGELLPVAYPGVNFDPPNTGTWLELRLFRNDGEEYGLGNDGPNEVMGFFRVIVCTRPGAGINAGTDIAEALILAIPKGTQIASARVYETPSIGGPLEDDNVIMHPVTYRYRGTRYT